MSVATEIADQIGRPAFFMMGAKQLTAGENSLTWRLGRNSKAATHVTVTLDSTDTYTVKVVRATVKKYTVKAEVSGVYFDQLHAIISDETGLELRLPTIRRVK